MKKFHRSTIILAVIFITGLSLLLYPTISEWWNSHHSSQLITTYVDTVSEMDDEDYSEVLQAARDYNASLVDKETCFELTEEQTEEYNQLLNVSDTGIMGYVEIPTIQVSLPIYHGTDNSVLQVAIGHITGSSLPVGGESTHCVISGHRGLPSAKLFTDINQLEIGDTFNLNVLDEVLTYEVDQILIVEPNDIDALGIIEGEDLCTLVTCTPFGINTQRLLVRGHRIGTILIDDIRVTSDAIQIDNRFVAIAVFVPIMIVLFIRMLYRTKR